VDDEWVNSPEGVRAGLAGLLLLVAGLVVLHGRPYWDGFGRPWLESVLAACC
jgi:hypothetical protein